MKFKVQDFVFNSCMIFEREIFSSQFHQHIMNKSQIIESKGNLTVSPEVQLNQQHTHTHMQICSHLLAHALPTPAHVRLPRAVSGPLTDENTPELVFSVPHNKACSYR